MKEMALLLMSLQTHYPIDMGKGNGVSVIESLDENLIMEVDKLILYFDEILTMAV